MVKIEVKQALDEFRKIHNKVLDSIDVELNKIGLIIEADAKRLMRSRNDESIEGAPPRVQTGRLRASITHAVNSNLFKGVLYVGTSVWYGRDLEKGEDSRTGRKRWKHPFLQPAIDKRTSEEYAKMIKEGIKTK
jgi:hypothetical protein